MNGHGRTVGVLAVVGAALIWSTSFAVTKVLLETVPPLTIGALRFTAAALLLAVIVRLQPNWRHPSRRARLAMGMSGLLGITVYFGLENVGVDLATASDATLIIASYPIVTLLLEATLGRTRITSARVGGMALAIIGVWLVVREGATASGGHRLLGDFILLVGGLVWAAYNISASRTSAGHSALTVTYYQTCAGAAGFLVLTPIERSRWEAFSSADLTALGYLAALCSIAAFLLYNMGLQAVPAATAVNILNLVPVFGLIAAVVVADESIGWLQVLGGAIVVAGVVLTLSNLGAKKESGNGENDLRHIPDQVRRGGRRDAAERLGGERGQRDHHDTRAAR